ncbi:MAG: hypothetical protein H6719_22620 [Sandaracinaceae bacterium]|nr:hypothetical protein [Sandaracinaceae bacterium]
MSDEPDDPVEGAPDGATCAEHPERPALVTCPRCGSYCCIACWHGAVKRCHACLLRDPLPPVPWADPDQRGAARFFGTLRDAFSPTQTAAKFTRGEWRRGIVFALLTALPIAALSGIIPFTHLLRFGPLGVVAPIGSPSALDLVLDVLQAAGLGLLFGAAKLGVMSAPYLSLTKAYGQPTETQPTRQVMLYRGWLLLLGGRTGLVLGLVIWGLPMDPSEGWQMAAEVLSLLPLMGVLWAMTSTARMARVGPIASMVVVLVPFVVLFLVEPLVLELIRPLLPSSEAVREAAQGLSTNRF